MVGKEGARGLGTEKLSYKEMNSLCKPKKPVLAPDSGEESVPRKKPKKAGAARVSLGVGDSDLHLPRKKKQKKQDPKQSCN